jgi:uncharacterized protein YqgC (DUF456 family)
MVSVGSVVIIMKPLLASVSANAFLPELTFWNYAQIGFGIVVGLVGMAILKNVIETTENM